MNDFYMNKALELAEKGGLNVKPNPLVGAVIVKNNQIIGEGYHQEYGQAHAEINAFLNAKEDVTGATMYVTLEPCSHEGKTGSCAKKIIEKGIKEVYVATLDPNPLVAGKGIQMLKDAGIEVHLGISQEQSNVMNQHFYHYITQNKPYVLLKMALTLDGKYATDAMDSSWITNEASRLDVHHTRSKYQAIMVGLNTVIQDDPKLNIRLENYTGKQMIRVILDPKGDVPINSKVIQDELETWIITSLMPEEKRNQIEHLGNHVIYIQSKDDVIDLERLLNQLHELGIQNIMVEGGKTLHESFLREKLFDEIQVYVAPKFIGGTQTLQHLNISTMSEALELKDVSFQIFENNIKITGRK
ncbi:MAG: bifunctional diaminohydroxyphosphoribosylaminopyrimidine deaminase/5-amino-6-(5-phosphoribosylamino)uracil reductase RibD [Firmicutes bacterium]|nr:bifunctional diaminohydroxyphosphoribosylaminopyrimidine deaminase/5-amino-6-(5-phosphoribosylamino)uracil reductase RibD [Bacillota bacterium]